MKPPDAATRMPETAVRTAQSGIKCVARRDSDLGCMRICPHLPKNARPRPIVPSPLASTARTAGWWSIGIQQMRSMLLKERLCQLFAATAQSIDPFHAHGGKIGWVRISPFAAHKIGGRVLEPAVVLTKIGEYEIPDFSAALQIKQPFHGCILRTIMDAGEST